MSRFAPSKSGGFTLVEVLVAVLVFSLLAATAYAGLNSLAGAVDAQRARSADFADLQRAVALLDRDLRQLVSRQGRGRDGRVRPALEGGASSLLARRAGRLNPAGLPRSQLQQIRWRVDNGLVRESWAEVDTPPDAEPVGRARFGIGNSLAFRYRDSGGVWHRQWPATARPGELPAAIEYVVETATWGPVRRVVPL